MPIVKFVISISLMVFFLMWLINIYERNVETEQYIQKNNERIAELEIQKQNIDRYGCREPIVKPGLVMCQ